MVRSTEQNRRARARTRASLVAAAVELFAERGVHGASVAEITRKADVAQGLVSYYFGGKDQLVRAVIDLWFSTLIGFTRAEGTADERLRAVIDGSLSAAFAELPLQRAVLAMQQQPASRRIFAEAEHAHAEAVSAAEDAIRGIFRDRGAADPALEEAMLRGTLEGVVLKFAVYGDTFPLQGARRWMYRLYGLDEPADLPGIPADAPEIRPRIRSS